MRRRRWTMREETGHGGTRWAVLDDGRPMARFRFKREAASYARAKALATGCAIPAEAMEIGDLIQARRAAARARREARHG